MRAALWMCTLIALPAALRAQAPSANETYHAYRAGDRAFGAWVGASLLPSAVFGRITDRRLVLTGLRLERVIESDGAVTTTYTLDLHPIAVVTNTPRYGMRWARDESGVLGRYLVETRRAPVVGVGVSPLGLQFYSTPRAGRSARLFAGGSAGGIWFNHEMPVAYARRFNFALQLGTGVELTARNGSGLVLGYKFHHLSNAGTAPANPGVDAHVVYVGLMRRRAGRGAPVTAAEE